MKFFDDSCAPCLDGGLGKLQQLKIVNEIFEGGNNYLHVLVNRLTSDNYQEVSEMIRILLAHRCSPNLSNDRNETPFYLLLKKLENINDDSDLTNSFLKHSAVSCNLNDDVIALMTERGLKEKISLKPELVRNLSFMTQLLDQFDEKRFINEFATFKSSSMESEVAQLMEGAIVRNLVQAVVVLLENGVDVNRVPIGGKFQLTPPAFLACTFGHDKILKLLLKDQSLSFKCEEPRTTLLHQICAVQKIHESDRQKCFDLIIADVRCTSEIINSLDQNNNSALFHASFYGQCEIAKELLRRGAFIGHESVINYMGRDVLCEFLDDCIKCSSNVYDRNCKIDVDYRFLVPPNADDKSHSEVHTVYLIAENSKLKELILHPVITSFLQLKWYKIDFLVYINLLVFFIFMIFLGFFIINFFHANNGAMNLNATMRGIFETGEDNSRFDDDTSQPSFNLWHALFGKSSSQESSGNREKRSTDDAKSPLVPAYKLKCDMDYEEHFNNYAWSYRGCLVGVIIMTIYEIIQCATSFKKYFFKLSKWLDITLIVLTYIVLIGWCSVDPENFKKYRAITILVMAAQTMQLIAKISFLSMSLHMTIFKKVCVTFLKTIALYLILILAFAMSFYTLNDNEENETPLGQITMETNVNKEETESRESFSNPFVSVITTIRMMLSDFDKINIKPKDYFQGFVFLLFVIFITVVLFNLLNALAISDTNEIVRTAELVDTIKRISILNSYEKFFKFWKLSFANIFPELTTIIITPNKDNIIKIKRNSLINDDDLNFESQHRKAGNSEQNVFEKLMFWRKCDVATTLSHESIKKITDFVSHKNDQLTIHRRIEKLYQDLKTFKTAGRYSMK